MTGCQDPDDGAAQSPTELDQALLVSDLAVGESRIRFRAGGEQRELVLVRNDRLLAPDARVVRDGVALTPEQAGLKIPYRGYVLGDPNSWIRIRVTDSGFEGLVSMDEGLWDVRESDDGEIMMAPADIADYVDSPNHGHHACATTDARAAHATYLNLGEHFGEHGPGTAKAGCKQIDIALVADYTHVAKLGGASASENEMLKRINETDGIYRADLNYGFSVKEIRTLASSGGPSFNQKGAGALPLDQFSDYKKSQLPELGLAHLFVARTTSGTVGLAWIGSTCSERKGTGVSNYLGKGKASTIIVAHEIGHNFGSPHDASNAPYIMAPSVDASVTEFSNNSESKIHAHVGSVSCFKPCGPEPDPEQPDPGQPGCEGSCGEQSPAGCWCDEQCSKYGDCCDDYQDLCVNPDPNDDDDGGGCVGSCGQKSPDGCWCDEQCSKYGDCCENKTAVCD
ncbi:MAG TPA: M12 family metallo-peptidase [Enhygromyxa sp.]|nr:M12 family metallo-peptidase [Enhygromyxa sp.]